MLVRQPWPRSSRPLSAGVSGASLTMRATAAPPRQGGDGGRQHLLLVVDDRDHVALRHVRRHEVAHQRFDRYSAISTPVKALRSTSGTCSLEDRRAGGVGEGPRIDRPSACRAPRGRWSRVRCRGFAGQRRLPACHRPDSRYRAWPSGRPGGAGVEPGQVRDFGPFAREGDGLRDELLGFDAARDQFSRHADQRFLVLDQAQADLLLRDLGVPLDRLVSRSISSLRRYQKAEMMAARNNSTDSSGPGLRIGPGVRASAGATSARTGLRAPGTVVTVASVGLGGSGIGAIIVRRRFADAIIPRYEMG